LRCELRLLPAPQITDDLMEAYRNRWLATESLLDHLEPQRPREREKDWLLRALIQPTA
jgi:hypothetical protein